MPNPHPNIEVGEHTYYKNLRVEFPNGEHKLRIGKFCSIAEEVVFILHGEHPHDKFSTYPFHARYPHLELPKSNFAKGDIVIGHDVWIGYGATILSGVTVGNGAIIGARAVVSRDVEPYAVVAGNPAVHRRYRPDVEHLRRIAGWWDLPLDEILKMAKAS